MVNSNIYHIITQKLHVDMNFFLLMPERLNLYNRSVCYVIGENNFTYTKEITRATFTSYLCQKLRLL